MSSTRVNTLVRLISIPAGHIDGDTFPLIGKGEGSDVAAQRCSCFRISRVTHSSPFQTSYTPLRCIAKGDNL